MSILKVDTITDQSGKAAPNLPHGANVTGAVTGTSGGDVNTTGNLTVSGNVGVGGTLTYEDVTDIDSIGIVTARSGLKIGAHAGVGGTFFADGSYNTSGIITATNVSVASSVTSGLYYGDGANLTGVTNGILEQISGQCDGSTRTVSYGTFTFPNVTAPQQLNQNETYDDIDASRIIYKPPSGCIGVLINFNYHVSSETINHDIQHYRLYMRNSDGGSHDGVPAGSGGTEILYGRWTHGGTNQEDNINWNHYFRIRNDGGSLDTNTGALPSWTYTKLIFLKTRRYGGSNRVGHFHTSYYWDGGGNVHHFRQPSITITAFGSPT